jgi:hypothetical protein
MTAHIINDCLRLALFLTGLRVSSHPLWWMTNEEFLLTHWTVWRTFVWRISRDWNNLYWTTFQADRISLTISNGSLSLLLFLSVVTKRNNQLLSNGAPTVDCVTSRMCLQKRCLAMDAFRRHVTVSTVSFLPVRPDSRRKKKRKKKQE